jgi:serine/threonine-protein kinase HipA
VGESGEDGGEFVRRLAFVIASGNGDAHLKNWSLIYPTGRRARLSPAYDQIATVVFGQFPPTLALKLGGRRDARFDSLTKEDLASVGVALGIEADAFSSSFRAALTRTLETFDLVAADLTSHERETIGDHFTGLKSLL